MIATLLVLQQIMMMTPVYTGPVSEFDASCELIRASSGREVMEVSFRGQGDNQQAKARIDGKKVDASLVMQWTGQEFDGVSYLLANITTKRQSKPIRYQLRYTYPAGPDPIMQLAAYTVTEDGGITGIYGYGLCRTQKATQ